MASWKQLIQLALFNLHEQFTEPPRITKTCNDNFFTATEIVYIKKMNMHLADHAKHST